VRHPFFRTDRRLVFAHRGGAALAPENTIAAFDDAVERGADGLELDVRLSRDGTVVVIHDETVDRTTNLRGLVRALTTDELARADAGYQFAANDGRPFGGRGIGVPTLAQVLARFRDSRLIVEMKDDDVELARATLDVIRQADALDRVCVGAFRRGVLSEARTLESALATSAAREEVRWALYRSWLRWPVRRTPYQGYQIPETRGGHRVVSPRFIDDAHDAGLSVHVWTVNVPADAERLLAWGVDAIITDRVDLILPVVRKDLRS
jgi:glycerophosphoryl diester phosphodiesterase